MPGNRFDSIGVAPLIEGVEFGALLADKAFDNNDIVADLNQRGTPTARKAHPPRCRIVQMAPSDRELLLQTQGIQTHRHACLQDRSQLRRYDLNRRRRHQFTMNPHNP